MKIKIKQEMRKKLYQRYPILKEKQVILYVPTFRKKETMMQTYVDKHVDGHYCHCGRYYHFFRFR